MNRRPSIYVGFAMLLLCCVGVADDQTQHTSLDEALVRGETHLNLRYRLEHVDQDGFSDNATASTLRLRLNYATGVWRNWAGFAEFDYVAEALSNNFNSGGGTSNVGRNRYPVVADPNGADLNQLYVDYVGLDDTRLRFGRQRILLDNQRFVGGVGWRQNEQTYDGLSVLWKGLSNTEISYAYVHQVNRIFGERSSAGEHRADIHLLNARIRLDDNWHLTPYLYNIDNDDVVGFSTATYGIRADGLITIDNSVLGLTAEYAHQSDAGNNPSNYDAPYLHLNVDWKLKNGLTLGVGIESLGGDQTASGEAFRTPLATLHKFQGWADKFLATPNQGIDDVYLSAKYALAKWTLQGIYHDFSAAEGSADWGTELDFSASRKFGVHYSVLLKAALFDADSIGFSDTSKVWIQLLANY